MAEGGGLLNRYTLQRRIEGSNPSVSARSSVQFTSNQSRVSSAARDAVNHPGPSPGGPAVSKQVRHAPPQVVRAKNQPSSCAGYFPISI